KDSPLSIATFFSTIARPATSSIVMALVLVFVHRTLSSLGAPVLLVTGSAIGAVVFIGVWSLFPGGGGELVELMADGPSRLLSKVAAATPVQPVAVGSEPAVRSTPDHRDMGLPLEGELTVLD